MQWALTRLALQAACRILFRRWEFRWSEAQANFTGRRTVVSGARVVSGRPAGRSAGRPAGRLGGARVVSGAEKKII